MLEFATSKFKNSMFSKKKKIVCFLWDCVCVLVAQLCMTLCNPMDCSPPHSSVHGILPARILE